LGAFAGGCLGVHDCGCRGCARAVCLFMFVSRAGTTFAGVSGALTIATGVSAGATTASGTLTLSTGCVRGGGRWGRVCLCASLGIMPTRVWCAGEQVCPGRQRRGVHSDGPVHQHGQQRGRGRFHRQHHHGHLRLPVHSRGPGDHVRHLRGHHAVHGGSHGGARRQRRAVVRCVGTALVRPVWQGWGACSRRRCGVRVIGGPAASPSAGAWQVELHGHTITPRSVDDIDVMTSLQRQASAA
jgi:hypothetical protein